MIINSNSWNKIRYTFYVPIYDFVTKFFSSSRYQSIQKLNIKNDEKVLLIGAGTGLDIEYISRGANIIATDITPAMVGKIRKKYNHVEASVMDGMDLKFPDNHFDKIILHLILAVIPDPEKCILEADRVLKPGGEIAVFDKFLDPDQKPSLIRKFFNIISRFLFTDINRKLEDIIEPSSFTITQREKANFNGTFKIYILKK